MKTEREVERKFTVDEDFDLADAHLPDGVGAVAGGTLRLEATYYDTADLRLAAEGITLRRRSGGTDDGWHLKLPLGSDRRDEISEPATGDEAGPPETLTSLVRVHVRGAALEPVARMQTRRVLHRLVGDGGGDHVLAEVMDDHVTAEVLGEQVRVSTWREVEVELADGDLALLRAVTASLRGAGAGRAATASKLERALGDRVPARRVTPVELGRRSPSGEVVLAYLGEQVAALKAADPEVRRDTVDAVHQMRVACRRLRTSLKTFRPQLDRKRTDGLRAELRWLATVLGDARDAEVMHARLRDELADEPSEAGTAAARARIDTTLADRYDQARAEVLRGLDSDRYLRLVHDLDELLELPPLTDRARRPARKDLPRRARRAWRSVKRLHRVAERAPTLTDRETALHEVRKAAKRARYAGEALRPVFGKDAKRFAAAMERLQEVLGEYQDSHVTQQTLAMTAAQAHAVGESTFPYGLLTAREQQRGAEARQAYSRAWRSASRRKLHAWTRS